MKIGVLVQARMSSKRLPGKVLRPLAGKPLLQYLLEGLERARLPGPLVVATSVDSRDAEISGFCEARGTACFRGSLGDVAGRFCGALERFPMDAFVRANADSPLLDFRLVRRAVSLFRKGKWDIVTNVQERTFPPGESVEVVDAALYRRTYPEMRTKEEKEHVTRHFYLNPGRYRMLNFRSGLKAGEMRLSVDTPEDFRAISSLISGLSRPHWEYGWRDFVRMRQRRTEAGSR